MIVQISKLKHIFKRIFPKVVFHVGFRSFVNKNTYINGYTNYLWKIDNYSDCYYFKDFLKIKMNLSRSSK
jgi:hypothetical protein